MTRRVNIQIKEKTWETLHHMKNLGDTFDDVIQRLIRGESK
jgi:predicted CopG family antitoxin